MMDSYLGTSAVLEWRYSFSQAEMILADNIPEKARTSYLAVKAVIKTHINKDFDDNGYAHKIPSYVLKTILFFEVEIRDEKYWESSDDNDVAVDFFWVLLNSLRQKIGWKKCPHYWIETMNLFADMEDGDFEFMEAKLKEVYDKPVKYIASEWLEWNRYMRKTFAPSYINRAYERRTVFGDAMEPVEFCCCAPRVIPAAEESIEVGEGGGIAANRGENSNGSAHAKAEQWRIEYDDVSIEVY